MPKTTISPDPKTTYLRMRRVAERGGLQLVTVGRGNGQYMVISPTTKAAVSPILDGLEQVERWLRVTAAERELANARQALAVSR